MAVILTYSEKYMSRYLHAGFFACAITFLVLTLAPTNSSAETLKPYFTISPKHNDFLTENAKVDFVTNTTEIFLPFRKTLTFSGNIYAIKKYNIFTSLLPALIFQNRQSIMGFGVTASAKLPLIQEKNWDIHLSGKISSTRKNTVVPQQKNRWNFEHQIGFGADYNLSDRLKLSLTAYHFRIIRNFHHDETEQSYINSRGGFATLNFQF